MELNPNEESVWTYFDAQHKSIMNQMKEAYTSGRISVECEFESSGFDGRNSLCYQPSMKRHRRVFHHLMI